MLDRAFKHKPEGSKIRVSGKWILAGEYAVLKSGPAIAFPLHSHFMEMRLTRKTKYANKQKIFVGNSTAKNKLKGVAHPLEKTSSTGFKKNFIGLLNRALKQINKKQTDLSFDIHIQSHIPFGAGMGASAVLCVLVGRLFQCQGWLNKKQLFGFCHVLENHLHGQSSGLDIAVVLKQKPILWTQAQRGRGPRGSNKIDIRTFQPVWKPNVFLSYAGQGQTTKQNIQRMKTFWKSQPEKAKALNQQMNKAVLKAMESLRRTGPSDNKLRQLKQSFSLAEKCFWEWDLVGPDMQKHIHFLKEQGALAVKPTGSGSGGYVLSLWPEAPPSHLSPLLIPAFTHQRA